MIPAVRLLIVHDQYLYRECLVAEFAATQRFPLLDTAGSAAEALAQVRRRLPHVVVADWHLPDKSVLGLTRDVTHEFPMVKVLILGLTETAPDVQECREAGAADYLRNDETFEHLLVRIEQVVRGQADHLPALACPPPCQRAELTGDGPGDTSDPDVLTPREKQILRLIADGLSNQEIARRLCLSLHMVKNHVHNLLEKLAVDGRYSAVRYAYEKRWLRL
jgi:DNA-binding NarL/FixJ family response regulator